MKKIKKNLQIKKKILTLKKKNTKSFFHNCFTRASIPLNKPIAQLSTHFSSLD